MRVLVIDRSDSSAQAVISLLEPAGYKATALIEPSIEELQSSLPGYEVIITASDLDCLSGRELVDTIHQVEPAAGLIIFCDKAYLAVGDSVKGYREVYGPSVTGCLEKPVNIRVLMKLMERCELQTKNKNYNKSNK